MKTEIKMTVRSEPEQISINHSGRSITLLRYLPHVKYYDLETKISKAGVKGFDNDFDGNLEDQPIKGTIFFAPAMAVKQYFYKYYLDYLSSRGYLVYSFDFSAIGLSKSGSVKKSPIDMHDWIEDLQHAVDYVVDQHVEDLEELGISQSLPIYYLCHSLGGQFFGFLSNQNVFNKFIGVTSQNGYWKFYKTKWRYFFFWHFLSMPITKLARYFPGKRLGMGENLPPGIMKSWKKWCTSRNYFFDDDADYPFNFDQFEHEMLTVSFDDDPWATPEAVYDLYDHYSNAIRDHWHFTPGEFGLKSIGHFGYYRPQSIQIWQKSLDWLES